VSLRKPDWLKIKMSSTPGMGHVEKTIKTKNLHTVCQEALCPNRSECYNRSTATFLLMGGICTRKCTFCNVAKGKPAPLDNNEPENIAGAVKELKLDFAVLTSVTRDDIDDGGGAHFAETIKAIKRTNPNAGVEVLIPDFRGNWDSLALVVNADCEVLNHNIETIPRLYPELRPIADYKRSVELLAKAKEIKPDVVTKTGIMLGLGETDYEIREVLNDLLEAGVDLITLGQYLAPSKRHHDVIEYVTPERFEEWRQEVEKMGFKGCASGPLVRSSYNAKALYLKAAVQ
jgi:lipoic acid synthetase